MQQLPLRLLDKNCEREGCYAYAVLAGGGAIRRPRTVGAGGEAESKHDRLPAGILPEDQLGLVSSAVLHGKGFRGELSNAIASARRLGRGQSVLVPGAPRVE